MRDTWAKKPSHRPGRPRGRWVCPELEGSTEAFQFTSREVKQRKEASSVAFRKDSSWFDKRGWQFGFQTMATYRRWCLFVACLLVSFCGPFSWSRLCLWTRVNLFWTRFFPKGARLRPTPIELQVWPDTEDEFQEKWAGRDANFVTGYHICSTYGWCRVIMA